MRYFCLYFDIIALTFRCLKVQHAFPEQFIITHLFAVLTYIYTPFYRSFAIKKTPLVGVFFIGVDGGAAWNLCKPREKPIREKPWGGLPRAKRGGSKSLHLRQQKRNFCLPKVSFFVYPSRRLGISSRRSRGYHHPLWGCISSRASVYFLRLDDIQRQAWSLRE